MEKAALNVRKLGFKVIVPQPSHIRHGHKPAELKNKYDLKTLTRWEGEGAFSHLENIRKSDLDALFEMGIFTFDESGWSDTYQMKKDAWKR